jgi:dihydroorotate dehydrogenase electron transfer subunit
LAELSTGNRLEVWGPLGNGFPTHEVDHLVMVAGGIGQTPFLAMARAYQGLRNYGQPMREFPRAKKISLCYGARRAEYLAGLDDFRATGINVLTSTDDGSAGHHGFVTDLLGQLLAESTSDERENPSGVRVVCCGPEPMMAAVARLTKQAGVPCEVSLETPMACGMGICFSCVVRVRTGDLGSDEPWDYRRSCVEGPVFDAARIVF